MRLRSLLPALLGIALLWTPALAQAQAQAQEEAAEALSPGTGPRHAIAMHGEPKYPADADHFDYADPAANIGGDLSQAVIGSFDSLNPFIVLGRTAQGVRQYHFAQLMARSWDEPFTLYSFVAATVETPEDRSWVEFQIDPRAVFHDGSPITVDDVVFSFETLRDQGTPGFRRNYGRVREVQRVGEHGIRFVLNEEADRETPLVIALMPIISKAWYADHPFDRSGLDIPLGSGPYRIAAVDPGRRIVFERVADWWAADLPAFKGQNNFARLIFDYYRDADVALEGFKTGAFNLQRETNAERWATAYDFPAARDGRVTLLALPHGRPEGMRGFAFNTRRAVFADPRVRQALAYAFDFEWVNRAMLGGQYRRTASFFENSELAATGLPEGAELALLEPFRDRLPPEVFTDAYQPPSTDGSGNIRANLRAAQALLTAAGYAVRDGVQVDAATGAPLAFEILLQDSSDERIALAFADNLRRLGIAATIRLVDSAEYAARTDSYDFDMLIHRWAVTLSPGAEQSLYWSSLAADTNGTRNYPGVRDPVVDALIDTLEDARTREDLVAAARALDRVLLWGHYVVPLYYVDHDMIAFWGGLHRVEDFDPVYGTVLEAWWANPMGP